MNEKVVVVAGVGPGIGASRARRFAAGVHKVALLTRDQHRLDAIVPTIANARACACDVGDEASVKSTFAAIAARQGEVGTLL